MNVVILNIVRYNIAFSQGQFWAQNDHSADFPANAVYPLVQSYLMFITSIGLNVYGCTYAFIAYPCDTDLWLKVQKKKKKITFFYSRGAQFQFLRATILLQHI